MLSDKFIDNVDILKEKNNYLERKNDLNEIEIKRLTKENNEIIINNDKYKKIKIELNNKNNLLIKNEEEIKYYNDLKNKYNDILKEFNNLEDFFNNYVLLIMSNKNNFISKINNFLNNKLLIETNSEEDKKLNELFHIINNSYIKIDQLEINNSYLERENILVLQEYNNYKNNNKLENIDSHINKNINRNLLLSKSFFEKDKKNSNFKNNYKGNFGEINKKYIENSININNNNQYLENDSIGSIEEIKYKNEYNILNKKYKDQEKLFNILKNELLNLKEEQKMNNIIKSDNLNNLEIDNKKKINFIENQNKEIKKLKNTNFENKILFNNELIKEIDNLKLLNNDYINEILLLKNKYNKLEISLKNEKTDFILKNKELNELIIDFGSLENLKNKLYKNENENNKIQLFKNQLKDKIKLLNIKYSDNNSLIKDLDNMIIFLNQYKKYDKYEQLDQKIKEFTNNNIFNNNFQVESIIIKPKLIIKESQLSYKNY